MILSIKRYLEKGGAANGSDEAAGPLIEVIHLLLSGLATYAVELNQSEYVEFRDEVLALSRQFAERPTPEKAASISEAALHHAEEYSLRISKLARLQGGELQRMVAMLTETVGRLASGNESLILNLQKISKSIEQTREVDDLRLIKTRLADCLECLQQETSRRRTETSLMLTRMKDELAKTRERIEGRSPRPSVRDNLTGFPDRSEAEALIAHALQQGIQLYIAVFQVQRLPLINARFGYAAGDQILNHFATHIRQSLGPGDTIFRWGGPCFVAALERATGISEVRTELGAISNVRLEKTIQVGARVAMVPVASVWSVFSLAESQSVEAVCDKVEQFTTLYQSGRAAQ
jgi:diguanylate cyclase (GGDEF)-like protein